jgi:elongation factor 1 alpha-like protein
MKTDKSNSSKTKADDAPPGKAEATVTAGVKALAVDDAPLPKSKNLDVVAEYEKSHSKKHASFVVVGRFSPSKPFGVRASC